MRIVYFVLVCILATLLATSVSAVDSETNYCHDPAAEAQWAAMLAKSPGDMDLQALHALRTGLCIKVDHGMLTVEQATAIFEKARHALIEYKKARNVEADERRGL